MPPPLTVDDVEEQYRDRVESYMRDELEDEDEVFVLSLVVFREYKIKYHPLEAEELILPILLGLAQGECERRVSFLDKTYKRELNL